MNVENYNLAMSQIIAHPNTWDQRRWHCLTEHCIGGWGQILSGNRVCDGYARRHAREFFDISGPEADYLFYPSRTLEDLKSFPDDLVSGKLERERLVGQGWFLNGYDADGLDRYNKPRPRPSQVSQ